jgi:hypothetical protein
MDELPLPRFSPGNMMPSITISYRRADTDVMAARIRDCLVDRYGVDAVFMDIDDIPFGKDSEYTSRKQCPKAMFFW